MLRPVLETGPVLSLRDVRFRHGDGPFALRVPELDVDAGRTVACVGASGSGKTTLLDLMAGISPADSGQVKLSGVDWSALTEPQRRARRIAAVGLVFQEFELLSHLTVRENILLPYLVQPALGGVPEDGERVASGLAEAAGIDALSDRKPAALSHGERQRVAICRALVTRPSVLLADEPTGNLDPTTAAGVLDLLLEQVRERHATLIMVTHDPALLDQFERQIEVRTAADGESVVAMR